MRILVNLTNGKWIRVDSSTYSAVCLESEEEVVGRLESEGFSREDTKDFIALLDDYGFTERSRGCKATVCFKPTSAYLNVTNSCNLVCPGCYFSAGPHLNHGLGTSDMCLLVDRLWDGGIRHLVVSGGEALSRPDISKILNYIKTKGFTEITLLTNATLVTPELAEVVAGCVDSANISIDGPDEETNAKMRGRGAFEPAIDGIRQLQQAGLTRIQLVTTLTKRNIDTVPRIRALAAELNVKLGFSIFADVGRGSRLTKWRPELGDLTRLYREEKVIVQQDAGVERPEVLAIEAGVSCGSGTKMVSVDCLGNVYPCHLFHKPNFLVGNLVEEPDLTSMLEKSSVIRQIRSHTVEDRKCHGCSLEYFCKGGCLAHTCQANIDKVDALAEVDPYCALHQLILSEQLWAE